MTGKKNKLKSSYELGKELDLYMNHELIGRGLPLLTPRGATIYRELRNFIEEEELKRGYLYTKTPILSKTDLFAVSGHLNHYQENMFIFKTDEDEEVALRPMTCPFQFILYKRRPRSYRELPLKYAEISTLFRKEKSGELMGLTRMWQFTLADAHIICLPEQVEDEFKKVLELVEHVMRILKIHGDVTYRFSKWDPKNKDNKYVNKPAEWERTQALMKRILDKLGVKYVEAEDEAAFYGPKLDVQAKNIYGKEDTLITIQIDFDLPERFNLEYIDENNKAQQPMVIHRSSIGCFERTMAFILEKYQGMFPLWLAPEQVRVLSIKDENNNKVKEVAKELLSHGIRAEVDVRESHTINSKIRDAELMKVPYIIVIGDNEEENNTIAVRKKGSKPKYGIKLDSFIKELLKEIKVRA